jgi:oxygen-dependent protoporphyrinogen oxidase
MKRIIIIGGGVAGLGAAYKITRAASEGHDVEFVLLEKDRRLGGKVHASDPKQMSLAATFPRLLEMEQNYGSLLKAFLAVRRKVEEMRRKYPVKPGEKPRTFFTSFLKGMQQLTDTMADAAGRERMHTGVSVSSLQQTSGGGWRASTSDGSAIDGNAVIIATESWAAEPLIRRHDQAIADALAGIPASSSATISVAFNESEVGFDLNAFGVLCPLVEGRALMAATYSSTKWSGRAPAGKVLLRGFVGGPHNQEILKRSDEELVQTVLAEFHDIVGLNPFAKPLFTRVFRWYLGMPQYTLGHLDRVTLIESHSSQIPGLALAGGSYRGVGVPNCIESGERAVSKILGEWGIDLPEDHAEEKRYY